MGVTLKLVVKESALRHKLDAAQADTAVGTPGKDSRLWFSLSHEAALSHDPPTHTPAEDTEEQLPKIKNLLFGRYLIDAWYAAPYPEEYNYLNTLFLCEYCLKYMKSALVLSRHMTHCKLTHPPGDEIYRSNDLSIFEVDGRKNKIYCQNLCLLAKTFLDHKTLYYDVEPFLFYILTTFDNGFHFVGYFSKEKRSSAGYNLSCIVTLPVYQRKGYGQMLIEFSYLLSKKEGRVGSPEKPLSELGRRSYEVYWRLAILKALNGIHQNQVTINDICKQTGMNQMDVVSTLHKLEVLVQNSDGNWVIRINPDLIKSELEKCKKKGYPEIKPELLKWTPFLLSRTHDDDNDDNDDDDNV